MIRALIHDNLFRAAVLAVAAWAAARWAWAPSPQVVESLWAALALILGAGGAVRGLWLREGVVHSEMAKALATAAAEYRVEEAQRRAEAAESRLALYEPPSASLR